MLDFSISFSKIDEFIVDLDFFYLVNTLLTCFSIGVFGLDLEMILIYYMLESNALLYREEAELHV